MPNEDGGPGGDRRDETAQRQERERFGRQPLEMRKPVVLPFRHRSVSSGFGGPTMAERGYETLKAAGELAGVVLLCAALGLIVFGPWFVAIHFAIKFW